MKACSDLTYIFPLLATKGSTSESNKRFSGKSEVCVWPNGPYRRNLSRFPSFRGINQANNSISTRSPEWNVSLWQSSTSTSFNLPVSFKRLAQNSNPMIRQGSDPNHSDQSHPRSTLGLCASQRDTSLKDWRHLRVWPFLQSKVQLCRGFSVCCTHLLLLSTQTEPEDSRCSS